MRGKEGIHLQGRPKQRFKDLMKNDLKACNISIETWQRWQMTKRVWRGAVKNAYLVMKNSCTGNWKKIGNADTTVSTNSMVLRDCIYLLLLLLKKYDKSTIFLNNHRCLEAVYILWHLKNSSHQWSFCTFSDFGY